MKSFAVLVAVAVSASTISAQTAPSCDLGQLAPLLTDPNLEVCRTDSGLSIPPVGAMSPDILTKACKSTACQSLLTKVLSFKVGNCAVGPFRIETDLIDPVKKVCPEVLGGAAAGSSAGSGAAAPAAEVTVAPVAKSETSGSTAASKETAPSANKTVPSPSPTTASSAAVVTAAASATAVAVAASLW